MTAPPDLIYDLGVWNGDDSAYYLHKGFRVVGVEASPLLIPKLRERFAREIAHGRYQLVPAGIAADEGTAEFWVCDDWPEWSSFDRSIASRKGFRHHSVPVPTVRFASLLEQFGQAHFCKIDIEGNDNLCVADLTAGSAPRFISVEMIEPVEQIALLGNAGYRRFKIISQRTFRQPTHSLAALKARLSSLPPAARSFTAALVRMTRRRRHGDWQFAAGSSGPFGDETDGEWLGEADAVERSRLLRRDRFDWYDIHASARETTGS